MKIGTIAAVIAALMTLAYVGPQLHIGAPVQVGNASAQLQAAAPSAANDMVEWIKYAVLAGVVGGIAAKIKRLF